MKEHCHFRSLNSMVHRIEFLYKRSVLYQTKKASTSPTLLRIFLYDQITDDAKLYIYSFCEYIQLYILPLHTPLVTLSQPGEKTKQLLPEFLLNLFVQSITQQLFTILVVFPIFFHVNASMALTATYFPFLLL